MNGQNVTTLTCLMQLIWLFDVDATLGKCSSMVNMKCEWNDHRLRWNSTESMKDSVQIPPDLIWFPSFSFNGHQQPEAVKPDIVTISKNGRVIFSYFLKWSKKKY